MDISIDIETLGTKAGSVVLSIGAIAFDRDTGAMGREFYMPIRLSDSMAAGLHIEPETLLWWLEQPEATRREAFAGLHLLSFALGELSIFVADVSPEFIWAKPPSFDIVILETAYAAVDRPVPWNHRQPECCRTLFNITGTTQVLSGMAHHALDDAKSQARGIVEAVRSLKATRTAA